MSSTSPSLTTRRKRPPPSAASVASVAGPVRYWNRNVGGSSSPPIPSGRLMSRTGRSSRARRQLPSPMWDIRIASRAKSMEYISVNCVAPSMSCAAAISDAVTPSPSAANA